MRALEVSHLTCEYREEIVGLDTPTPRFSWAVDSSDGRGRQAAWRMTVYLRDGTTFWEGQWVQGSQSAMVVYPGPGLAEECEYQVRVAVRDVDGAESPWSEPMRVVTSFFAPARSLWDKLWLCPSEYSDISPMFRRPFAIAKLLDRAVVYVTGVGYYQLFLNGRQVGGRQLDPVWTDYARRVLYATFDVTEEMRTGENVLGLRLGSGWFMTSFFKAPQFALRLHLFYRDGSDEWIESRPAGEWRISYDGEIRENSIYHGEVLDATLEKPGWAAPGFAVEDPANGQWRMPLEAEPPGGLMKVSCWSPLKLWSALRPKALPNLYRANMYWTSGKISPAGFAPASRDSMVNV